MPRIRSLKPEIWHSHDMTELSILGRLVFIVLITQADDEGRLYGDAHHIAKVFLGDGRLTSAVQAQLERMQSCGMATCYLDTGDAGATHGRHVGGRPAIALCNFNSQQRIDHPRPSRIQKPPGIRESSRARANPRESSTQIKDQIRPDQGSDRNGSLSSAASGGSLVVIVQEDSPRSRVFNAWVQATGRTGRTRLDSKRARLIDQALSNYTEQDVIAAVWGWRHSPHHRGENDRQTVYNDLELLLRDSRQIEKFRDLERNGPPLVLPAKHRSEQVADLYRDQAAALRAQGQ